MNRLYFFCCFTILAAISTSCDNSPKVNTPPAPIAPPFSGTIFIDPDIVTADDPTTFETLTAMGKGSRVMYDRRVRDWITVDAYLFLATFDDGLSFEVQVNPEFESNELSQVEAEKYSIVIGRLPSSLRLYVQKVWIHKGEEPFGGGNNSLLIHVGQANQYASSGILEETLIHEASHTSLDATHATSPGWLDAQQKDRTFISTYARDNPTREDIAETFLLYLAVKHRKDRISSELEETVLETIPNRINYLDTQSWSVYPWN